MMATALLYREVDLCIHGLWHRSRMENTAMQDSLRHPLTSGASACTSDKRKHAPGKIRQCRGGTPRYWWSYWTIPDLARCISSITITTPRKNTSSMVGSGQYSSDR